MTVQGRRQTAEGRADDGSRASRWSEIHDQPLSAEWSSPPQTSDEVLRRSRPPAASGSSAEQRGGNIHGREIKRDKDKKRHMMNKRKE